MTSAGHDYSVSLDDEQDANSTARLVEFLLNRNLQSDHAPITLAQKISRPVAILNTTSGRSCTVVFGPQGAVVYNQLVGRPAVTIRASLDQILNLSQIRVSASGLSQIRVKLSAVIVVVLRSTPGRRLLRDLRARKMVVNGLLRHPVTALRAMVLLSTVCP